MCVEKEWKIIFLKMYDLYKKKYVCVRNFVGPV